MPLIISALSGALISLADSLVGRVLASLALGFVEFTGLDLLVSSATSAATQSLQNFEGSGLAGVLAWAGFFQLDVHLCLIISAVSVKLLLNSMSGGTIKRLVRG